MKSKQLIAFFLLLVLSIQILPLQRIAAWLSSGQATEEISHNINPVKAKPGLHDEQDPFIVHTYNAGIDPLSDSDKLSHNRDELLFIRDADDIITPPPNC